ncbi:MAG: geranylgeranylglycerol-phosphate geranylgeranyltransferase [Bacteroidota bacterium]|nr:geranylgeranylglycerol-phosphate geranylgeranyltransferase [Bacteroidota bacterium]
MAADRSSLSSKRGNLRGLIRLARPLNLGIAASTLVLLKFGWLARWQPEGSVGLLPTVSFAEGTLVVVLLMMSGNWINAYFDVHEDRINRPDRAIVGRTVKRRVLIIAHQTVNALGLLIALHLSWSLRSILPILIAALVSFSLWRYSTRWKATPLLGNTIVAALLGMVPVWLAALEVPFTAQDERFSLWLGLAAYGTIATGIGLVRELAKDALDVAGDREAGKNTFAVRRGTGAVRTLCLILLAAIAIGYALGIGFFGTLNASISLWMAPLPFWLWSVVVSLKTEPHWKTLSQATLWMLLAGTVQCLWIPG